MRRIEDITGKQFDRIAIAKPDVAPYGQAAVESLQQLGIWNQIEPRVIYAQNVSQARQYAATGNSEVAFIPLALVKPGDGTYIEIEESLHRPINQALGVIKSSAKQDAARQFASFVLKSGGAATPYSKGIFDTGSLRSLLCTGTYITGMLLREILPAWSFINFPFFPLF